MQLSNVKQKSRETRWINYRAEQQLDRQTDRQINMQDHMLMEVDNTDFFIVIFLTEVKGGLVNTQRPEIVNSQTLGIKLLLQ